MIDVRDVAAAHGMCSSTSYALCTHVSSSRQPLLPLHPLLFRYPLACLLHVTHTHTHTHNTHAHDQGHVDCAWRRKVASWQHKAGRVRRGRRQEARGRRQEAGGRRQETAGRHHGTQKGKKK